MANDKKNINELVTADDDPTAELETLVLHVHDANAELESDAHTAGFDTLDQGNADDDIAQLQSDLALRSETIDQLQFQLAQLQARYLGLEAEVASRGSLQNELHAELATIKTSLKRKQGLLRKRDQQIKALRQEIRERNETYEQLQEQLQNQANHESMRAREPARAPAAVHAATNEPLSGDQLTVAQLQRRYSRMEEYADQLRRQLQDSQVDASDVRSARDFLDFSLQQANERADALESSANEFAAQNLHLADEIASLGAAHAEELRMLRFELGAAQETVTQHEMLTEQLASDLVETRTYRVELENMLNATEENNKSRIEKLEKENRNLRRQATDLQQKLETKNEAINCLIGELAKKSQQIETMGGLEEVIHEIDDRVAERIDSQIPVERDRVTRVLIGSIDDQELRFPLFKDRLTIGRTAQNDIQLKASHISRRHAVIVTEGSATRVIDWGSKNGVYVNSTRVTEHFLKHGDVLSVGTAEFRYEERPKRES